MTRKFKFNDNDKLCFGSFIQRHKYSWQKAKPHTCANKGVDSERGLHIIQDALHYGLRNNPIKALRTNDWYFQDLGNPLKGFYRYGNRNPFSYFW